MIADQYGCFVSPSSLYKYKDLCMYEMLEKAGVDAKVTGNDTSSADKLIVYFKAKTNISYIYILHDIESRFVTNKHNKNSPMSSESTSQNIVSVSISDINSWRANLKVKDSEQILVAMAWCHNEDIWLAQVHPYLLLVT